MNESDKFEQDCKKIQQANKSLLDEFELWLKSFGLSTITINNHIFNIDFYINTFLLYDKPVPAKDGADGVDMFLGYWFIKKALWASQSSIKNNAASVKKFYTFMLNKGLIEQESLVELKQTIKENMSEWLEELKHFDDPLDEDVW